MSKGATVTIEKDLKEPQNQQDAAVENSHRKVCLILWPFVMQKVHSFSIRLGSLVGPFKIWHARARGISFAESSFSNST